MEDEENKESVDNMSKTDEKACEDRISHGLDDNNMPDTDESEKKKTEDEERSMLLAFIAETEERIKLKEIQRQENSKENIKYPEESFFVKLDSSIKKNSAFVKKLKNMSEAQKDSIFKDMNGLNLTKYISEVANSVVEAKIKMSEIGMVIKLCSTLHQRYADFSSQLLEAWHKSFPKKPGDAINAAKMRIDLRLYAELISSGIFTLKELNSLGNLLIHLTSLDKEAHTNLSIILSFCRHCGDDYAGLIPRKFLLLSEKYSIEIPKSQFLVPDKQKGVRNLLKDYFKSLTAHLIVDHKAIKSQDRQLRKVLQMKGEVPKERKEKFDAMQVDWQKLFVASQQFADILDEDLPDLPVEVTETLDENDELNYMMNIDVSNRFKNQPEFDPNSLWEDEDTRSFYQCLPDLKAVIPSILYKDSVKEVDKDKDKDKEEQQTSETGNEEVKLSELKVDKEEGDQEEKEKTKDNENLEFKEVSENEEMIDEEVIELMELENVPAILEVEEVESDEETGKEQADRPSNKVLFDAFITDLPKCVNRDMIDKAAFNFCTNFNTKNNRKKLVRALYSAPRTRLDLLPFYARFVAQVFPIMPNVATELVTLLKQEFRFHFKKKDQMNIESKVKVVRFIGELVKFDIYSKSEALFCLKVLLSDFSHHHIEMTCHLLEICGRFLYRSAESHIRTKLLLDQMMRKKALLPFDNRHITSIENAYYYANPPDSQAMPRIERPPIQEYIRKLLYNDLTRANVDKILRQFRKLNWDDTEISSYAIKSLIAIWNVKFYNVRFVANLLAGLNIYQDWITHKVIDGVLEDIRLMMEINHHKYNQRRIAIVKYLAELYNYRLIESSLVFKMLYSLITYGVYYEPSMYSELDPPDNLIRLRLVSQILETCGQYFSSGLSKKKLECFLVFFQRYFWLKKSNENYNEDNPFPFGMEHLFKEAVLLLRPKFKFADSYESAVTAVEDLMTELKPKVKEVLPNINLDGKNEQQHVGIEDDSSNLNPIAEVDEEQEDSEVQETSHAESNSEDEYDGRDLQFRQKGTSSDEGSESENNEAYNHERNAHSNNNAPKMVHCPEDDDFMKDFDKMMSESLVARNSDVVRTNVDIVIPTHRTDVTKKAVAFTDGVSATNILSQESKTTINFVVMTKSKGNKPVLKNVDVPIESEMARSLKIREEEERVEKQAVKKLILDISERREMEERDAELANKFGNTGSGNRDQRRRYQHPKGAPDADSIFGNNRKK